MTKKKIEEEMQMQLKPIEVGSVFRANYFQNQCECGNIVITTRYRVLCDCDIHSPGSQVQIWLGICPCGNIYRQ